MSTYYLKKMHFLFILLCSFHIGTSVFLKSYAFSSIDFSRDPLENHWTEINWRKKELKKGLIKTKAWIRTSALFDEWNFATSVLSSQTVIPFYSDGRAALNYVISKNTLLKVQKVTTSHIQTRIKRQNLWISKDLLKINPYQWGYLVSKHKTPLREKPSGKSKIIGYLPAGLRLTPLSFQKEFVQIEWKQKQHFIPFSYVISRLNFAKKVQVNTSWKDVLFVMGHWIKTTDHQFISIDQVKGMQGGKSLAYNMASKVSIRDKPQTQAAVLQIIDQLTPLSITKQKPVALPIPQKVITTDQLFKRKIFDVASTKRLMLASANGIFRSSDGISWEKLIFFENKDFPLAISPSGKLYIGPYRSIDNGKTFHQYIRWDLIFNALKSNGIHAVSELSIKDIEFPNNSSQTLKMTLQMGRDWSKKVRLTKVISYDEGKSWSSTK